MNILFAISFVRWGGVNTWMLELGGALKQRGHHVHVVAPAGHKMLARSREQGLEVCDTPFGRDFLSFPRWLAELRRRRIDVVVLNTSKEVRTLGVAARLRGLPVAQWVGLTGDLKRNTPTTRFERGWIVDQFIIPCESMLAAVQTEHPHIDHARLVMIRPGKPALANPPARAELQRELGLDPARFNAVVCSQLTKGKGHAELLEAIRKLRDDGAFAKRGFHLSIFHTGAEEARLREFIATHALDGQVALRGFSDQVRRLLPAFDAGMLPSHWEGIANNLCEYMVAGLCPIVSAIPGNTELIEHRRNGLVHQTGDALDMTKQLGLALERPDLVTLYRQEAARDAAKLFGMEPYVTRMEKLFTDMRSARGL